MRTFPLSLILLACCSLAGAADLRWERGASSVALVAGGKTVWQFRHGDDVAKPMFHPLALTDGTVLTWDSPPDHPWHHALWFAWKYINHVNYWEEARPDAGAKPSQEKRGTTTWDSGRITPRDDFSASIVLNLSYHEPGQPPVLRERRVIEVSRPNAAGVYHLDWTMTFTAADHDVALDRTPVIGDPGGVVYGGYAGLSIRFAKDFAAAGTVTTKAADAAASQRTGLFCESGSTAVDFNGVVSGREAGVALLDHPSNLHSPTPWYLIIQPQNQWPFHFAEAAVIYYKPHVLKAGESVTLRYRVVVHPGRWDRSRLVAAQQRFAKEVRP
jgi:hypothetical protein